MTLLCPPALGHGDRVAIVAPAGPVEHEDLASGIAVLEGHFNVSISQTVTCRSGYLGGDDETRRKALQDALDDDSIHAVLAARGGYGTTRFLDRLDLTRLTAHPKWVVGSSDLTALLLRLWTHGRMLSIHGPMPARFVHGDPDDSGRLIDLLSGKPWPGAPLEPLCFGRAQGPMLGGNLTILAHLCGTVDPSVFAGAVLFLEDVGERPYRLDRCLVQLRRARILEKVAGIVLGDFTDCLPGPDGTTTLEVLQDHLGSLEIPVARGYPAAHGDRNTPFIHGLEVYLEVGPHGGESRVAAATE